jgi:hypothetical protein
MWEPRRLTTLWVSTASYRGSFNYYTINILVYNSNRWVFAREVKLLGREADHSPPFSDEVEKAWSYTAIAYPSSERGAQLRTGQLRSLS